jgi:hypothetical protein
MAMPENTSFPWLPDQGGRGGEPRNSPVRHATRVGDAERDAAAQELGDHFAAGRLTLDELQERLSLVLSAQTRGQLIRVMADLPTPHQATFRLAHPQSSAPVLATDTSQEQENAGDTAGKVGAVALLLLAILIWLFTALLFAGHGYGYYHPQTPPPWWHH